MWSRRIGRSPRRWKRCTRTTCRTPPRWCWTRGIGFSPSVGLETAPPPRPAEPGGGGGRGAAGLLRIGNTVGAAITNRRVLEPVEARIMIVAALVLLAVGVVVALFPTVLAYPLAAGAKWGGGAVL